MSSHCIAVNRAPKRTGTRVECNNIATTNRDTRRGRGGGARGCRGDLSRPIHARGNFWQKGQMMNVVSEDHVKSPTPQIRL